LGVCGLEKLLRFEGIEPEVRKAFEQRDESMERKTNIGGTEPNEPATPTATSKAAEETGKVLPRKVGQARRYFVSGWRFARHLLEMVLAMGAGTAVLGVALAVLGEPPGYANVLLRYGLMGASISAPMVAWMRYRGHSWSDGLVMMAAMLAPMFALVIPVALGVAGYVPGLSEDSLMMLSHVAMITGMVVLMIYRFERYAYGSQGHCP
jgi:flagellar biosynthetic protein FliP